MIDEVLIILKKKLNVYFKSKANVPEDKVAFLDGAKMDPISFPVNNVVPLLINIEEEKIIRAANRYEGVIRNGTRTEINPRININLLVLFVCKFSDYEQSLKFLSLIIKFFQHNQVLDPQNTPELEELPNIEKLKLELITLPIAQQNELWSSLRTTYLPSVLYKVSLLVFRDDESSVPVSGISEIQTTVLNKNQT